MRDIQIGIVGATGLVGQTMLKVLESYKLPILKVHLYASSRSKGEIVYFNGKPLVIQELTEHFVNDKLDIVLFAVDSDIAKIYAPMAAKKHIYVIDNSSAFRMHENIKLIVPEVNINTLEKDDYLIANPNCSTIQSVVPLKVIKDLFGLEEVDYTSYQAVSGSGHPGLKDLDRTKEGLEPIFYPKSIYENVIPQIDHFTENGFTKEELKMVNETRKILNQDVFVSATCVRVPVRVGHSVSMKVTTKKPIDLEELIQAFQEKSFIKVYKDPTFPTPKDLMDSDDVHIGRIRMDLNYPNKLLLWTVADNVRKGAASNAVQIAEYIIKEFLSNV